MKNNFSSYKNYIYIFLKYKILFIVISCSNKKFWLFIYVFFLPDTAAFSPISQQQIPLIFQVDLELFFIPQVSSVFILESGIYSLFAPDSYADTLKTKSSRLDKKYLKYFRGQSSFEAP